MRTPTSASLPANSTVGDVRGSTSALVRFPCDVHGVVAGEPCLSYVTCTVTTWIVCARRGSTNTGRNRVTVPWKDETAPGWQANGSGFERLNACPR